MDPVFLSLATALVTDLGEKAGNAIWSGLVRLVRGRTADDAEVARAVESARTDPGDDDRVRLLAEELRRVAESDADLLRRINEAWREANLDMSARRTHNELNGTVLGGVVQTGTLKIDGDLNFGRR